MFLNLFGVNYFNYKKKTLILFILNVSTHTIKKLAIYYLIINLKLVEINCKLF